MAVIFCSGLIFFVISFMNIRNMMAKAISMNLKYAIAGGIGLFIALIGLEKGGIIVIRDSSHLGLSQNLCSVDSLVFFVGLLAITVYHILRMKGAILLGICTSLLVALVFGKLQFTGVCSLPPSPAPVHAVRPGCFMETLLRTSAAHYYFHDDRYFRYARDLDRNCRAGWFSHERR